MEKAPKERADPYEGINENIKRLLRRDAASNRIRKSTETV